MYKNHIIAYVCLLTLQMYVILEISDRVLSKKLMRTGKTNISLRDSITRLSKTHFFFNVSKLNLRYDGPLVKCPFSIRVLCDSIFF